MILLLGVVVASFFAYLFTSVAETDIKAFISLLLPGNSLDIPCLIAIIALSTGMGLPRQVAAFAAGFVFSPLWGTWISLIGVTLGCIITYSLSYKLSFIFKAKQSSALLQKVSLFFQKDTFYKAFVIRILPVGSNFMTNILAGLSQVSKTPYLIGSSLGFIPQLYIFSLAGSGIRLKDSQTLYISIALLLCAILLGYWLYNRSSATFKQYI